MSIALTISFILLSALTYLSYFENAGFSRLDIQDFDIGMVADRDIVANRNIEFTDQKATGIRKTAARHSVTPVFDKNLSSGRDNIKAFSEFSAFAIEKKKSTRKANDFKFLMIEKFPTLLDEGFLENFFESPNFYEIIDVSANILKQMYDDGLAAIPIFGIETLNDTTITLVIRHNERQSYENIPIDRVINIEKADE